ncbi:MAG: Gfo/Idh/MocA family protein [Planctomycetaceae bacterium]
MASFQSAVRTIEQGLATGQIGEPVAARILMQGIADHGHVERMAAAALARTTDWFACRSDQMTAQGSVASGQVSTLARFERGQTALVSAGSCGAGRPLMAVHLWGNRGMLSWVDDEFAGEPETGQALSDAAAATMTRLRSSLASKSAASDATRIPTVRRNRPPQPPPYGVLLVAGDYTHQPAYAQALAADPRCRLVGLTDKADVNERRRTLNEQLARRLEIPVLPDLQTALAREDVQIVSLCAEPHRRGRIAVLAAEAGKHLYLDKPLAGSIADADAIVTAVQQSGVVAHMFSLTHSDAAERVRALVASGELGELTAIHLDLTFAKGIAGTAKLGSPRIESPVPDRFELIESKREFTNVGVYAVVHLLTLLNWRVRAVTATTGNYFFREHQQDDLEDFGQMLLEFDGGVIATVSAGRTGWKSHPGGGLNRASLIGTRGCALVDGYEPRVEVWADAAPWQPPDRNPDDPMGMWAAPPGSPYTIAPRLSWLTPPPMDSVTDVSHFLDCIEHGRESVVSAEVAAAATEVLMAGYQSAATGTTVALPLPR